MTAITITPNLTKKSAKVAGTFAAGEHVSVTIPELSSLATSTTMYLRVMCGGSTIAQFPEPVEEGETEDTWGTSGTSLTCTLNMNTIQALKRCRGPQTECLLVLEELGNETGTVDPALLFVAPANVMGWPQKREEEPPYDLGKYPGLISTWQTQIDTIAASVSQGTGSATISITDKDGVITTATVHDGAAGAPGAPGAPGSPGAPGRGVPDGGTTGQVLAKRSNADGDTQWADGGGVGAHASTHAIGGTDPITPASIGAVENDDGNTKTVGFRGEGYNTPFIKRVDDIPFDLATVSQLAAHTGNTSSNPHSVTKAQVGLGNVDNTSDANKPISTATQNALNGKAGNSSPSITGWVNLQGQDGSVPGIYIGGGWVSIDENNRITIGGDVAASVNDLPYSAESSDAAPEARMVRYYKIDSSTTLPLAITLPTISAYDTTTVNLDLVIDASEYTTADPEISISTGGAPLITKGAEGITSVTKGEITVLDFTSIPGYGDNGGYAAAWLVMSAGEFGKVVTNG